MSTTTRIHQDMVAEADAILREVRGSRWPQSYEAIAVIGGALLSAEETREVYARVQRRGIDPYTVLAPDMGWWDDPQACALEYTGDQYHQAAEAAQKRLAEYVSRETAVLAGERGTR